MTSTVEPAPVAAAQLPVAPLEGSRQPSLSIVVTTMNRPRGFARLVDQLVHQVAATGRTHLVRLVAVFDGCNPYPPHPADVPVAMDVRMHTARRGIARARNTAIDMCDTDLVAFIDDDAIPTSSWLSHLYRGAAEYPDRLCFGGRVFRLPDDDRLLPRLRDEVYYLETFGPWYRRTDRLDGTDLLGPPYVNGGNCAYRREVFDQFGNFHDGLPAYVDVEFGRRVRCQETGVLLNGFSINHEHPSRLTGYLRRAFTAGQARARLRHTCPEYRRLCVARSITRNLTCTNLARSRRLLDVKYRALGVLTLQELTHAIGYIVG